MSTFKKNSGSSQKRRAITPIYILSYLLLSEDVWRLAFGGLFAYILAPSVLATRPMEAAGVMLVYIMLVSIGWWAAGYPAKKITQTMMQWLRNKINQKIT